MGKTNSQTRGNSLFSRSDASKKVHLFVLLALPAIFSFIVTLNLFYRWGAYYLDAGVQQFSLCNNALGEMPPAHQSFWGQKTIFFIHGIYTPALLCGALKLFTGSSVVAYIIFCSLQTLLVSLTCYFIVAHYSKSQQLAIFSGFLLGISTFSLGQMGYPHFELLGASLLALGVWLFLEKSKLFGIVVILLGCLTKEDMAGHLILALGAYWFLSGRHESKNQRSKFKPILFVALIGLITNILISKIFFNSSSLLFKMQYMGDPPFSILRDPVALLQRISIWLTANPGIMGLLFIYLLGYVVTKERIFLALVLTPLPWIAINLISPDPAKQTLGIYHGYPFVTYICCLMVFFSLETKRPLTIWTRPNNTLLISALLFNSLIGTLGALPGGSSYLFYYNLKDRPVSLNTIHSTNDYLRILSIEIEKKNTTLIDDAVASLITEFDSRILNEKSLADETSVDTLVYFPNNVLGKSLRDRFSTQQKLTVKYCIVGTNLEMLVAQERTLNDTGVDLKRC